MSLDVPKAPVDAILDVATALENKVGARRCRPVNLRGRKIFAERNLVLLRRRNTSFS